MRKGRVLIVDDSPIVRETVKQVLGEAGFTVTELESPRGIGKAIVDHRPDLILLDVMMPNVSGEKLLEASMMESYEFESTPVVLFSDRSEEELSRIVATYGAAGYLRKTDDAEELVQYVTEWVDRARRQRRGADPRR